MPASPDGYFYLTSGPDNFKLSPGLLAGLPIGLLALDGNDTVLGSSDAETINGNQGEDSIQGGGGDDLLLGGKGRDVVSGDEGNDLLNGNIGEDYVFGGAGNDTVRGGKDADILNGGDGNDVLIGDFGADLLTGGAGGDLFILRTDTVLADPNNADFILDFGVGDRIGVTGGLAEANLVIKQQDLPLSQALGDSRILNSPELKLLVDLGLININDLISEISKAFQDLTGVDIDPNRDGIISGTAVELSNGTPLGFVVNVAPGDVTGRIIPVADV